MLQLSIYAHSLAVVIGAAFLTWLLSLCLRNVAIVDSLWSLLFVLLACTYVLGEPRVGPRAALVLSLILIWALRLSIYITWRNWGQPEDRRYQAIRARNQPHFELKSLYLIFVLQALLAWIISMPLLGASANAGPLGVLDYVGAALWLLGFVFEAGGDWQLARFQARAGNQGKGMGFGFWGVT